MIVVIFPVADVVLTLPNDMRLNMPATGAPAAPITDGTAFGNLRDSLFRVASDSTFDFNTAGMNWVTVATAVSTVYMYMYH